MISLSSAVVARGACRLDRPPPRLVFAAIQYWRLPTLQRIRPANPPRHALTWWSTNLAFRLWEAMVGGPVVCCLLCLLETIAWLTSTATPNITPMINGVVFLRKCAETVGCQ
jgi:hypothetical protein